MAAFNCKFSYRVPGLQKVPAEVTGRVLDELANSEAGLTPKTLVDASRDENAPLHGEFEWRDDVAAEKYRQDQARGIILNLRVVTLQADGSDAMERAYVVTPGGESRYVYIQTALEREDWRDFMLEQARRECKQFLAKYKRLQGLAGVVDAMQRFLDNPIA